MSGYLALADRLCSPPHRGPPYLNTLRAIANMPEPKVHGSSKEIVGEPKPKAKKNGFNVWKSKYTRKYPTVIQGSDITTAYCRLLCAVANLVLDQVVCTIIGY